MSGLATITGSTVVHERPAAPSAVHRFVSARADACAPLAAVRGEARWQCRVTECPGACRVVHVITVLGERRGRWRRVSQTREHPGDTGECGCCTDAF